MGQDVDGHLFSVHGTGVLVSWWVSVTADQACNDLGCCCNEPSALSRRVLQARRRAPS